MAILLLLLALLYLYVFCCPFSLSYHVWYSLYFYSFSTVIRQQSRERLGLPLPWSLAQKDDGHPPCTKTIDTHIA